MKYAWIICKQIFNCNMEYSPTWNEYTATMLFFWMFQRHHFLSGIQIFFCLQLTSEDRPIALSSDLTPFKHWAVIISISMHPAPLNRMRATVSLAIHFSFSSELPYIFHVLRCRESGNSLFFSLSNSIKSEWDVLKALLTLPFLTLRIILTMLIWDHIDN